MVVAIGLRGGVSPGKLPQLEMIDRIRDTHTVWNSSRMPFATPEIRWQ
jgi:hypothetical protein